MNAFLSLGAASAGGAEQVGDSAEADISIVSFIEALGGALASRNQSHEICDSDLIRLVFPRDTMKHLARLMAAPLDTARHLLYRRFSASRRRELAEKLL